MKKTGTILRTAICAVLMFSSLLFAAVEGFNLFSGDWKLFENEGVAFFQTAAKILLSLFCFAVCLSVMIRKDKPALWEGIMLLGMTLSAAPFVSNNLGWLFVALAALFMISELLMGKTHRKHHG